MPDVTNISCYRFARMDGLERLKLSGQAVEQRQGHGFGHGSPIARLGASGQRPESGQSTTDATKVGFAVASPPPRSYIAFERMAVPGPSA